MNQVSKNKKELIVLIVLIVALAGFALYFYVLKPRSETIDNLTREANTLSSRASSITRSVNSSTSINNQLTEAKGEAMQYSALYLSGGASNSGNFDKLKDIVYTIFADGEITEYSAEKNQTNYYSSITQLLINTDGERIPVYQFDVSFSFTFQRYQTLMDAFANLADNYPYLFVTNYTLSESEDPFTANITIEVHMLECNLDGYKVGTCPCVHDGEVCGHFNEFDADTCIYCGGSIDNCPNATCGVLIELNEDSNVITCPVCESYLKKCQYCGQYMLRDSDQCPKCNQMQD